MTYLYQSRSIPAMQQVLYSTPKDAALAPVASLALIKDKETGLITNSEFKPDLIRYDSTYQNDQSLSSHFQSHLNSIVTLLESWTHMKSDLLVEVGCGQGAFVELLLARGFNAVGYDKSYQGDSPFISKQFFGNDTHEKGDLLILRHVIEHIPMPWDFLRGLAEANGLQGYLYIETPCLDWILKESAYFDLFHEHVNYFRLANFERMYGSFLVHSERSFGGQYLSLVLDLSFYECPGSINKSALDENEDAYMSQLFDTLIAREKAIYNQLENYENIVIWGAGAKGVTFCSKAPILCRSKIDFAIDINPAKQGMFMPISAIPVLSPDEGVAKLSSATLVVIMNLNYLDEILELLPEGQPHLALHL